MSPSIDWRRLANALGGFPIADVVHTFATLLTEGRRRTIPQGVVAPSPHDRAIRERIHSLDPDWESMPDDAAGRLYEALLAAPDRKASGSHYTPAPIAERLVTLALANPDPDAAVTSVPPRIADLASGGGAFLLAAANRVAGNCQLIGCERDPIAAFCTRVALAMRTGEWPTGIRTADGLTAEIDADVIVGNPPYLFGEQRDGLTDPSAFELAVGQWDTSWLFVERALQVLPPHGRLALLLPDSILARDEPEVLRRFVMDRVSDLHVIHIGPVFDAGVSVIALIATRADSDQATGGRFAYDRVGATTMRDLDAVRADPRAAWLPATAAVHPEWLVVGDLITISRGEEVGKRSLVPLRDDTDPGAAAVPPDHVPVVAGSGVVAVLDQPRVTHSMPADLVRKPPAMYDGPKVIAVKTGATLRAGLDLIGLVTLQSAYNIRPADDAPDWFTARFLCGLLVSRAVNERFIEPITTAKDVFPQITQSMIRAIRFPRPPDAIVDRLYGLVALGHRKFAAVNAAIDLLFEPDGGGDPVPGTSGENREPRG